ncbi:MAG TPA: ImmA/IrrE family metallo-endopeptidase [Thermoleophilia bacterium]|nr:ImmA/IrrE family metallo-endopeptidase [Thermoleophilia bacterium]
MDEQAAATEVLARFLATYGGSPPPVDVDELAESLCCLRVRQAEGLTTVPGAPTGTPLSGMLLPARKEVWVNIHEPWERRRFSVAHEVGHFLLHAETGDEAVYCRTGDLRPDPDSPERLREREANRFAAELLMPAALIEQAVATHGSDPFVLAEQFRVSEVAMAFRLVNLAHLKELPVDLDREWRQWQS